MRRAVFLVLCLAVLAGCGQGGAAPVPTAALNPSSAQEPVATPSPEPQSDNPYEGSAREESSFYYHIFEAFRGADIRKLSEERGFTYLDYTMKVEAADAELRWWYSNSLHLPQCPGKDDFAVHFSRYFREVYQKLLAEERAYLDAQNLDREHLERGLSMRDEFFWNGYYQVVLTEMWITTRSFAEPVVVVFEAETGEKVELASLFQGDTESWLPTLGQRLREKGMIPSAGAEESQALLQDATFFDIDFAVDQGVDGFRDFMLTPNGLGFAFRTGLVSSMAQGPVVVVVPYEYISDLLTPEFRAVLCP